MNTALTWVVAAALALSADVRAQSADDIAAAQRAAETWLSLADEGRYAQTWDEAAPAFQRAVAKPQWEEAIRKVRSPLGALSKRSLKSAVYSTSPPGAPAGEYVVIQYRADFAHVSNATETVTPMRGPDGKWKVSGYFIR